jgi:hypothetical protein
MNAWFAEIAIGIGASFAATLLAKATLTLAVAHAVTGLARRSRAAARHVLLVAAFAVLLVLPVASYMMPSRGVRLPASPVASSAPMTAVVPVIASPPPTRLGAQVQAPSDGAQQPPLAFETASVKPNKSGEEERYIRIDPSGAVSWW